MSDNNNPYDGLDLGPERFQPEEPGESIVLHLAAIDRAESKQFTNADGSPREGVILKGATPNDEEAEWAAWSVNAKRAAAKANGLVGDTVRITFDGFGKARPGFNAPKLWSVEVINRAVGDLPTDY